MPRSLRILVVATLLLFVFFTPPAYAGGEPIVSTIFEGRDTASDRPTLNIVGKKVSKFVQFNLADSTGKNAGPADLIYKSKSLITVRLGAGLAPGTYDLTCNFGKGDQIHRVQIRNNQALPGSVMPGALSQPLIDQLGDAKTLESYSATYFRNAGNVNAGLLGTDYYSAIADLIAESRLGDAAGQVAKGDHDHDGWYARRSELSGANGYVSKAGDTMTGALTVEDSIDDAINGISKAASGTFAGVEGIAWSSDGAGVVGQAIAPTGATFGVLGLSDSSGGVGICGEATSTSGLFPTIGVEGLSWSSAGGSGVFGSNLGIGGTTYGVHGHVSGSGGTAGIFAATSTTGFTKGVSGISFSTDGIGVWGDSQPTTGFTHGVYGTSQSNAGRAVAGVAWSQTGFTFGGWFGSQSSSGTGLYAQCDGTGLSAVAFHARHNGLSGNIAKFSFGNTDRVIINLAGDVFAAAHLTISDRRHKTDIRDLEEVLAKARSVRIVRYRRKDAQGDAGVEIGVVAQELRELFPELVHESEEGLLSVQYGNLAAVAVGAIQEQQKQIEAQQRQIDERDAEIEKLRVELSALGSRVEELAKVMKAQSATPGSEK